VAWDKDSGAPICNAIVWQDQRTARQVEALLAAGVEHEVRALSPPSSCAGCSSMCPQRATCSAPNNGVLSVDGGLTRCPYFIRFFAAAAERQIVIRANDELTAFGAAMLAANDTIPIDKNAKETIEPATIGDMAEWRRRFSAARSRSSGWRS
jgi:glycerol kinase